METDPASQPFFNQGCQPICCWLQCATAPPRGSDAAGPVRCGRDPASPDHGNADGV